MGEHALVLPRGGYFQVALPTLPIGFPDIRI